MDKFLKIYNYYPWKYLKHILQSKWHYRVLKATPFFREGGLAAILWCDIDLMVPWEPINKGVGFLHSNILQHFIYKQRPERVLETRII